MHPFLPICSPVFIALLYFLFLFDIHSEVTGMLEPFPATDFLQQHKSQQHVCVLVSYYFYVKSFMSVLNCWMWFQSFGGRAEGAGKTFPWHSAAAHLLPGQLWRHLIRGGVSGCYHRDLMCWCADCGKIRVPKPRSPGCGNADVSDGKRRLQPLH